MKKNTKKYIEYLYLVPGLMGSKTDSMEIGHNNPMKVDVKESSVGFRFYEKEFFIDGEKKYEGEIKNTTNWFYIAG